MADKLYSHPIQHQDAETHHHHTHAQQSHHTGGHHLLQVENLSVSFSMYDAMASFWRSRRVESCVIDNLTLSVHEGEILAVVGASGSGKTLLADAILGLYEPNVRVSGTIWFDGKKQDAAGLAALRGHGISMVPQSVLHLDPLMRVGEQMLGNTRHLSRSEYALRVERMHELMATYELGQTVERMYPHELSGGMARRVLLICALMDNPRLIVADEPTPGLDLDLAVRAVGDLRSFAQEGGGVLLITHDIELALRAADRVAVFTDGAIVEEVPVTAFDTPETLEHPFSRALWHAMPEHDFSLIDASVAAEAEVH